MNRSAPQDPQATDMGRWIRYPDYRDSGVQWLAEIPSHWAVRRLKHVVSRNDGGVWGDDFDAEGSIVLRSTDVSVRGEWELDDPARRRLSATERQAGRVLAGDLVVTKSSGSALHLGKTALVTPDIEALGCCFSNFMQRLRLRLGYEPRFIHYFLNSLVGREQLNYLGTTTTGLANLSGGVIGRLQVGFPPRAEQTAIADFLDRETGKIDVLVAKKERLIELLQEKRTALISQAVTKGLDPNVPMKDSGIEWMGEIPMHWRAMRLKFAVVQAHDAIKTGPFGSQLLVSEMTGGDVKVYTQANVVDHDLDQGYSFISRDKYQELRAFTVYPGDIMVTTRGTIGRCVIVPDGAEPGILHPCLMRVQADPEKLLREFLAYLIEDSSLLQTQLMLMSNATTIDVIYSNTMREVSVPVPPLVEQHEIVGYLRKQTSRLGLLSAKVARATEMLREYRTALISAAVTGKIDVQEAAS